MTVAKIEEQKAQKVCHKKKFENLLKFERKNKK